MKSNLVFLSFHTKAVPFRQLIKVIVFLLLFILSFFQSYAQQPTQEWVARIPGPYNDVYGPFLSVDKQGNSYVAGTHVVNDTINILCVKYNTAGVQQWSTLYKYPGYGYFVPTGLAIDTSGNAYVISDISLNSFTSRTIHIVAESNIIDTKKFIILK